MANRLRACTFRGKRYFFHRWFQEGGQLDDGGCIDIGAVLEDEQGNIQKVFAISEIKFEVEVVK